LDTTRYELDQTGRLVSVEPRIFDLLVYLVEHAGRTVPTEELLAQLYPNEFAPVERLTNAVAQARKALADTGQMQRYIHTVRRRAYRFLPPVAVLQQLPPDIATPRHITSQAQRDLQTLNNRGDCGIAWRAVRPQAGPNVRSPAALATSIPGKHHNESTTFIGRRQYLDCVATCFQDAQTGHPRVVFLRGEAGVGKSRLLRELRRAALHQVFQVWMGRCYEGMTFPSLPFLEALLPPIEQLPAEGQSALAQ